MKTKIHNALCKSYSVEDDFIFNNEFYRPYMVWDRIHSIAFLRFSSENKINISWDECRYLGRTEKKFFKKKTNFINSKSRYIKELQEDED